MKKRSRVVRDCVGAVTPVVRLLVVGGGIRWKDGNGLCGGWEKEATTKRGPQQLLLLLLLLLLLGLRFSTNGPS